MAFYSYYDGRTDYFYSTPYQSSEYNMVPTPFQAPCSPSSWCEFNEPEVSEYNYFITPSLSNYMVYTEPKLIQYSPVENHSSADEYHSGYVNPSEINYSVYHCTEPPKLLQYEPSLSSERTSKISYPISTEEFNEPGLKDNSPYRGGYDPITTYGRPLPPSDEICHPRSTPHPDVSLDDFDYSSIPSPYGKDGLDNLSTKLPITVEETDLETDVPENGGEVTSTGAHGDIGEPIQSTPSANSHHKHDDDDGFGNGRNGDYYDKIGMQTSYGSGLEAMDLCESIFGYWPCLDKIERQQRDNFREIREQESRRDPWKLAADYLFGSPVIYDYENYHHQEIRELYAKVLCHSLKV